MYLTCSFTWDIYTVLPRISPLLPIKPLFCNISNRVLPEIFCATYNFFFILFVARRNVFSFSGCSGYKVVCMPAIHSETDFTFHPHSLRQEY